MVRVSVHKDVELPEIAAQYAQVLEIWKKHHTLPDFFGNEGQWEENRRLCDSYVYKIHIQLPDQPAWKPHTPQAARKSNHYLVYSWHWLDDDRYQVISIMSPDAHEKAKTSFMTELERRAEEFQNS